MGDICNYSQLLSVFESFKPEVVIHLAAQPLVSLGYAQPRETFLVNTQGTANLLEACRVSKSVTSVVCVTTDKVYKNGESYRPYTETDELGGKDPYSGSKAAAEHIINSYMESFGGNTPRGLRIAIARGGNIIGGGDWSLDRLVPDFARAVISGGVLTVRYPDAIRPWQHVLALVQGYLQLAACLVQEEDSTWQSAWNFGPAKEDSIPVLEILEKLMTFWAPVQISQGAPSLPEAGKLFLDSSKARQNLDWQPSGGIDYVLDLTARWYRDFYEQPALARQLCLSQISDWFDVPSSKGVSTK
jgi:CDP-glucose 4,6-dehydratase